MAYDISVVLGSKNRKNLLKATINSIRKNGFNGKIQIIVIDGGSIDGTCDWLAKQRDIFTMIQPNYKITDSQGIRVLAHSWGEFMNIAFKYASAPYIVMVSDDLILENGCLQKGYDEMERRKSAGEKIGSGAFFFREFPRHKYYRVGLLPNRYIALNHGFYVREALESIGFLEEKDYNFYFADSDVIMRLNLQGWETIALNNCFAEHLCHKPIFNKKRNYSKSHLRDMEIFYKKYPFPIEYDIIKKEMNVDIDTYPFYRYAIQNVFWGYLLRIYDFYKKKY